MCLGLSKMLYGEICFTALYNWLYANFSLGPHSSHWAIKISRYFIVLGRLQSKNDLVGLKTGSGASIVHSVMFSDRDLSN
jgi:hypothetical protein